MQSYSNELSTSVADSVKCKQTKVDTYALNSRADVDLHTGSGVCHQPDIKLGRFRPRLETSHVSVHTEELLYNEIVTVDDYIYIYVCVCVCK